MISFREARRHLVEPLDPDDRPVFVSSNRASVPGNLAAEITFRPTGNYVLYIKGLYITQQEDSYYEIYRNNELIYSSYRVPLLNDESWDPPWRGVKIFKAIIYNLSSDTKEYDCRIKGWLRPVDNHLLYERRSRIPVKIPKPKPVQKIQKEDITENVI